MDAPPPRVTDWVTDADLVASLQEVCAMGAGGLKHDMFHVSGPCGSECHVHKRNRAPIPGVEDYSRFCEVLPPP